MRMKRYVISLFSVRIVYKRVLGFVSHIFRFAIFRLEIVCKRCQSHLGHVFAEDNATKDELYAERHCVNGISIRYVDQPVPEGVNDDAEAINN
jgi:peptide methionine sulfoxide reductase MsrB